jgi:hypothetical protein
MEYEIDKNCQRVPVNSSQIKEIMYLKEETRLFIRFYNDSIYTYHPIPENVWLDFKASRSKGKFFYKKIKTNKIVTVTKTHNGK